MLFARCTELLKKRVVLPFAFFTRVRLQFIELRIVGSRTRMPQMPRKTRAKSGSCARVKKLSKRL